MSASFEEKSVWVQLVAMVVCLGAYFVVAGRLLAAGVRAMPAFIAVFAVAVVGLVLFLIAGHVIAAISATPEGRDERDRLISWRAESNSSWLVGLGALLAVNCMALGIENVWTANLLILCLALSELLSYVLRIRYYRKGV